MLFGIDVNEIDKFMYYLYSGYIINDREGVGRVETTVVVAQRTSKNPLEYEKDDIRVVHIPKDTAKKYVFDENMITVVDMDTLDGMCSHIENWFDLEMTQNLLVSPYNLAYKQVIDMNGLHVE